MASAERSMSCTVVDQLLMEIRIAAMPCQTVPPSQALFDKGNFHPQVS